MCVLICSVLCCWLGVGGGGHILLGSNPLALVMLFSLGTQRRDREGSASVSGEARGGDPARTHFLLSTFQGWLGSWAVALLRLPGKLWGFSACVCFELVYSVLPGALVNDVDHASLFFVHLFYQDCCLCLSGKTCTCLGSHLSTVFFFFPPLKLLETRFFPLLFDTGWGLAARDF